MPNPNAKVAFWFENFRRVLFTPAGKVAFNLGCCCEPPECHLFFDLDCPTDAMREMTVEIYGWEPCIFSGQDPEQVCWACEGLNGHYVIPGICNEGPGPMCPPTGPEWCEVIWAGSASFRKTFDCAWDEDPYSCYTDQGWLLVTLDIRRVCPRGPGSAIWLRQVSVSATYTPDDPSCVSCGSGGSFGDGWFWRDYINEPFNSHDIAHSEPNSACSPAACCTHPGYRIHA